MFSTDSANNVECDSCSLFSSTRKRLAKIAKRDPSVDRTVTFTVLAQVTTLQIAATMLADHRLEASVEGIAATRAIECVYNALSFTYVALFTYDHLHD